MPDMGQKQHHELTALGPAHPFKADIPERPAHSSTVLARSQTPLTIPAEHKIELTSQRRRAAP
jgi:hypothetical protein